MHDFFRMSFLGNLVKGSRVRIRVRFRVRVSRNYYFEHYGVFTTFPETHFVH